MKLIMVSSSPKIPILLTRSVVAQATAKTPSAAGPRRRATRNVNTPRKFEASIAMKFVQAPRFNSGPGSTRWTTPPGGVIGRSIVSAAVMERQWRPASSAAARMAANDQSVLHLMDPIAGLGDLWIVSHKQQRLAFFLHDPLEQFEGAPGIRAVEISRRLVGEDHARIVGQGPCDRHPLLFATGKMTARPFRFLPQTDFIEEISGALEHFRFAQPIQPPHRDHDVFLRGEIFEQKMELKDESEQLVSFSRKGVIGEMRDGLVLDRDPATVRLIEQAEDVEQGALATTRRADDRMHGAALEL